MKPDLPVYLGKWVHVRVGRPLGSVHPRHPDIVYPVNIVHSANSGELPGPLSGHGHPIDAYLLGWCGAVAVAIRNGTQRTDEEITNAFQFQERYFQTTLTR